MNINNIEKIIQKHNISAIVEAFNREHFINLNTNYYGDLLIIMYDRTKRTSISTLMGKYMDLCLEGWMPNMDGSKSSYDFLLTINQLVDITEITKVLQFKEHIHIIPLFLSSNDETGNTDVSLDISVLKEIQQQPKPILN